MQFESRYNSTNNTVSSPCILIFLHTCSTSRAQKMREWHTRVRMEINLISIHVQYPTLTSSSMSNKDTIFWCLSFRMTSYSLICTSAGRICPAWVKTFTATSSPSLWNYYNNQKNFNKSTPNSTRNGSCCQQQHVSPHDLDWIKYFA